VRRQVQILYLEFLEKQVPQEFIEAAIGMQNEIDQTFSTFRGSIGDESFTDNDLLEILRTSRDSQRLQAAWEASKQVGEAVAPRLLDLVRLRNRTAQELGFDNYFRLQLTLQEFEEKDFLRLFDDLDALTRAAFETRKAEVDKRLAARYGIRVNRLQAWHYQNPFFQEAPAVFDVDLDALYSKADILDINQRYYSGMGLDTAAIIARSDLYEKEGKNPHAYCTDIDRQGDVRVFANIRPNDYWMGTMLHELGHAVYDQYIAADLPWVLRAVPHTLNTEAIAMLFGRMSKNADWLTAMLGLPPSRAAAMGDELQKMLTFEQLLFSRWVQVMVRFELALYSDPEQDLNALWWKLVERYQGLQAPAGRDKPDYAAKYHVAMAPVYYHNYLLGELMASQVHDYIARHIVQQTDVWRVTYIGRRDVGDYLRSRIFAPGAVYGWNDLIKHATGETLSPRAFAAQFVQDGAAAR
jgi:peptidyl-dipeptidase A